MNRRLTVLSAISSVVLVFALVVIGMGIDQATSSANQTSEATVKGGSDFVFEGCWAYFPAGPCYDIYRDSQGDYWICSKCGETKKPGPKTCNPISEQTLARGYWCS